jgi:SsrA-binding protein
MSRPAQAPAAVQGGRRTATGPVKVVAENRRARHDYEIMEQLEAGLVLLGSEVKSLRSAKGSIAEAWVRIEGGEAVLVESHIALYPQAGPFLNHEPKRERRLLMKAAELERWGRKVAEKGLTVVPLQLHFHGQWAKLQIGLGRGRKLHDKRAAIKEKDDRKEAQQAMRNNKLSGMRNG